MTSAAPKSGDRLITAEEFAQMPDDVASELVRGRVVEMARPTVRHGVVCANLVVLLGSFVRKNQLGILTCNDAGHWIARDPDTVRGPDIGFVAVEHIPSERLPEKWWHSSPDLVIEVISPSDRYSQVEERTRDWLDGGAREVWLVDPGRREVKAVRSDGSIAVFCSGDTLSSSLLAGFTASLDEVFAA